MVAESRNRLVLRLAAPMLMFATAACGTSAPPPPGTWNADAQSRLILQEELRIGSLDDPDHGFSGIGGVDVDRDGQLYVLDALDLSIRVYAPDGPFVRRFGRRGGGPGEFAGAGVRFGVGGDTVWTYDRNTRRLAIFHRDGTLQSDVRVQEVSLGRDASGQTLVVAPMARLADGTFIGDKELVNAAELLLETGDTLRVPRVRFDGSGQVVDTVGWYEATSARSESEYVGIGSNRHRVPAPGSGAPYIIALPDGRWLIERPPPAAASDAIFHVARYDLAGAILHRRAFHYTPVRFPEAVLDQRAGRAARQAVVPMAGNPRVTLHRPVSQADSATAHAEIRARMAWPEFRAPIQGHHVGADGALWLRREDTYGETYRWLILDPTGQTTGELEVPRSRFRIAWSRGDVIWVVEPDAFDVPWLVRYRLRPAERATAARD